jgi:hypothetical protein
VQCAGGEGLVHGETACAAENDQIEGRDGNELYASMVVSSAGPNAGSGQIDAVQHSAFEELFLHIQVIILDADCERGG